MEILGFLALAIMAVFLGWFLLFITIVPVYFIVKYIREEVLKLNKRSADAGKTIKGDM